MHSPRELVAKAKASGLEVIALTDHDNVGGIPEAIAAGKEYGVEVIPGVELSLTYNEYSGVHLLGYYIDYGHPRLNRVLTELRQVRAKRGERIVERINQSLEQQGKPLLDIIELRKIAKGSVGRPHISQMLIERGYAGDQHEAFERYLVPYNVPKMKLSPVEGIELINEAKGLAVLAHPTILTEERKTLNTQEQLTLLNYMLEQGLDGVEAFYTGYGHYQTKFYQELAQKNNLVVTAGSDFHQDGGDIKLGKLRAELSIPNDIVERLREKYKEKYGVFPAPCTFR
jgi:hypothetical protein